ncbi:DedA family protein [Secundilactobacillus malefermentans]|uniref:VTT domain-containing protein n=1 Tax=Secundilactobacillus malefermentans TaxID=176292 RepID=A0A4R5NLZ9_9LACO|nr:DedA family protein [Secundilactobacillus malefermentans]KRM57668.1 alkaline phosphatase [Secundilactobacillus malefermentans DSM 5705 = KCTC 3548]QEA31256.1 DedA family protein [Secundilactobacillus malefermentans]TDG76629.1 hypothetical protein C5L31_000182 [Secundilactobacillus malefermentans]
MNMTTITDLISQYGYIGIALLIALENIFPPIPSEVILTFTGFLTLTHGLSIVGAIIAATVGSIAGALVLYGAGRLLKVERLEAIINGRLGKILRLKATDIEKASNYFLKHGGKTIFLGRFVPIIRSMISIPAGMTKYPLTHFMTLSIIGTLIWNTVLIYLGHSVGSAWPTIVAGFSSYSKIAAVLILIGLVTGAIWWYVKKKKAA